jgi:hypothetical protein
MNRAERFADVDDEDDEVDSMFGTDDDVDEDDVDGDDDLDEDDVDEEAREFYEEHAR